MKIAFYSAVSKSFAVVAATIAVAPLSHAQNAAPPSAVAPTVKTPPAKNYNRALDADLIAAVLGNDLEQVRNLLDRNADPNAKGTDYVTTPALCSAAQNGFLEIVRALVDAGADIEKGDLLFGNVPLVLASTNGRNDVIRYLLQKGANLETKKFLGTTPLMRAAGAGKKETVRLLLEAGANVHVRSTADKTILIYDETPLMYACSNIGSAADQLEIVKMMIEAGADVSAIKSNGQKAYEIAADHGLFDINKYLVGIYNRDSALNNVTAKAVREMETATSSTRLAAWQDIKSQVAKGANPRYTNTDEGVTMLTNLIFALSPLLATLDDNDATMKTILARSDLDAKAKVGGFTALHAAVDRDNAKMVKWLIKANALLSPIDSENRTPLDFAITDKNQNLVSLLKNAGAKTYAELK